MCTCAPGRGARREPDGERRRRRRHPLLLLVAMTLAAAGLAFWQIASISAPPPERCGALRSGPHAWAHATNEPHALEESLLQRHVHIEADVSALTARGPRATGVVPTMDHRRWATSWTPWARRGPPFLLDAFLARIVAQRRAQRPWPPPIHVKLDIKAPEAIDPSVRIIGRQAAALREVRVRVWLNADVLRGPGLAPPPAVDADTFVRACAALPNATCSLGWTTTGWTAHGHLSWLPRGIAPSSRYTPEMVVEMRGVVDRALALSASNVVVAARASLVRPSWAALRPLRTMLTVWAGREGVRCEEDVRWMRRMGVASIDLGRSRGDVT